MTDFMRKMPYRLLCHRDRRTERLHRTRHFKRGAGLPRAYGHARRGSSRTRTRRRRRSSGQWNVQHEVDGLRPMSGVSRGTPSRRSGDGSHPGPARCASPPTSASTTAPSICRRWRSASTSSAPVAARGTLFDLPAQGLREEREEIAPHHHRALRDGRRAGQRTPTAPWRGAS